MAKVEVDDLIAVPIKDKKKGSKDREDRTFLLKCLDPSDSTIPTKTRSYVCFRASSPEVKELWLSSLEPLCGNTSSSSSELDGTENDTCSDDSQSAVSTEIQDSSQSLGGSTIDITETSGSHSRARFSAEGVDANIEIFSKAIAQYMDIVRDQLMISVPKAVTYLFLEKISETFSEGLVNRLIESL